MTTKVHGIDASVNHGAIVELTDGEMSNYWFWSTIAKQASKKNGMRLPQWKMKDKQAKEAYRLLWLRDYFKTHFSLHTPEYACIEDYAYNGSGSLVQIAEVVGACKIVGIDYDCKLRLHAPSTVKMFTAHNGNAGKEEMIEAVRTRWQIDFTHGIPPAVKGKEPNHDVYGDLHDAYALAQMCWTEVQLRRGDLDMRDLTHPKEIQAFNKVSKTYPTNILGREWIGAEI